MKFRKFIVSLFIVILGFCGVTSCAKSTFIDYANTSTEVRLKLDYKDSSGKNRNFYTDGISEVTVFTYIDGDTVHFKMKDSSDTSIIKGRFYGIDTPESTGSVEMWGKSAANFTKNTLSAAKTIVITSTSLDSYVAPETDSTGSRYLTMVWFSNEENASYKDLILLNLLIVQEGYSYVKALDKFPEFSEVFLSAEQQARNNKLNLFSDEKEEGYNDGEYLTTSLLDLKNAVVATLKDSSVENKYNNARVKVRGTVAGYSNNILYLQASFFDENTGLTEYAGINIFCGKTAIPSKYSTINTYLELCALAQENENYGFQLTSVVSFPKTSSAAKEENATQILYTADNLPEQYRVHYFTEDALTLDTYYDALFSPVTVNDTLVVTGGYKSDSSGDLTLYTSTVSGSKTNFSIYIPFIYQPFEDNSILKWRDVESFETGTDSDGNTITFQYKVSGVYSFHKTTSGKITFQIVLRTSSDLTIVNA